jgi:hypothetical protein
MEICQPIKSLKDKIEVGGQNFQQLKKVQRLEEEEDRSWWSESN